MPKRNIVWIAIAAVVATLLWQVPQRVLNRDALYHEFGPLLIAREQIRKNYVDEIKDEKLLDAAIDGMAHALDPFCDYFPPDEVKQFETMTEGQFQGIGIEVRKATTGEVLIISPIEGSPALQAGLRDGDLITAVNGGSILERNLTDIIAMITGPSGTSVNLTIRRPGIDDPFDVDIARARITVRSVRGWARNRDWDWDYLIDPDASIAYLRISAFENRTSEQLEAVIRDLLAKQQLRGLILDLRNNGGGLLDTVTDMADLFLSEGTIVSTRGRAVEALNFTAKPQNTFPNFPMVILVNGRSASASEILAGALRDHGRAILVGTKTYGKGSVQGTFPVPAADGTRGKIKITTSYYYLPKGERIHGIGVMPQYEVKLSEQEQEAMIESILAVYRPAGADTQPETATQPERKDRVEIMIDPQLQKALELLRDQLTTQPA